MTVSSIVGGNAPYDYKLITNAGTFTNTTGVFNNPIDCTTKITVADSCSMKTYTYNIAPTLTIDCVNFWQGTGAVTGSGGIPPFTYQCLVNNVVVATSTTGQFTGLPTTPAVKKYDFKVIDACNKSKTVGVEALKPTFSGTVNCGPGGTVTLKMLRNNNANSPLFFPITVSVPTATPTNFTYVFPSNQTTFTGLTGNPNIFTIQDACGEKVICKDSLILNLNSNCVNISAVLKKLFLCDNQTGSTELGLGGVVTYTLSDAQGNVIATNTTGVFTAPGPGTYTVTAVHPTCGTLTKTITVNPGTQQINPQIDIMLRYFLVNGKCIPRYTVKIADTQGPFFLGGGNNLTLNLTTANAGFYYAYDVPPGTYSLVSTTFCTSVPLVLPMPNYNLTAQVTQSCPGDAQILVNGANDFAYWKNWFQANGNLNLITWYNNGGPHKDFYTTNLSNNYTGFTGSPYTIKNLNAGQTYKVYIYPFDAKESGGNCPVDTATVVVPAYNQLKVAASRGIICDGATTADIKVWVLPVSTASPIASGRKNYTYQRVSCANLTSPIGAAINTSDTIITFPSLSQGTHCLKVVDACGVSADFQTEVSPLGAGQYIGVNCGLLRLQVDTIPSAIYSWKNTTTGQNLGTAYFVNVATPAAQATFSCDITIGACMMVRNVTIPAGVGLVTVAIQAASPTTFCQGQNVALNATGNANTYKWSTGQVGKTISASASGTYKVTATNLLGCVDTASVLVNAIPPVTANLSPQNINCFGQNNGQIQVQNIVNQFVTYLWSNSATTQNISNLSPNNYTLTVTDAFNCKTTFNAQITQPSALISQIASSNITCFGNQNGEASVTPNGGTSPYNYQWSNGKNTAQISALSSGNYTAIVTDTNGCTYSNVTSVSEPNPLTLSTNPANPMVCIGEQIPITATPKGGNGTYFYQWNNGFSQATQTLGKGAYSVTVTDNKGCKADKNINVVETSVVSVPLLNSAVICAGTAKNLEVGGNLKTFKWSTGATSKSINISQAQQYCVTVTTQGGCLGDTCINIAQVANPQPIIQGDTLICKEAKTQIKVTKNFSKYEWNNSIFTQNNSVSAGKYQVTVTDANGCLGVTNFSILPRKSPNISIFPNKKLCTGDSILLKAAANALDFKWNNGKKGDAIFAKNQGQYCVTITDKFGCVNDTCLNVAVFPLPKPTISGDSLFCKNEITTLKCNEIFSSYEWSNGAKISFITTSKPNIYTLKVIDNNNCVGEKNFEIKDLPLPIFTILGDTSFCTGKKIKLSMDKNFPFCTWSSGEKTHDIDVTKGGKYTVEVTDSLGCKNKGEFLLKENPLPKPTISGVTAICANSNTSIKVNEDFVKYFWSNNEKTQSVKILQSGVYKVSVTDKNGCENNTEQEIKAIAKLTPVISGDLTFCQGEKSELKLNAPFAKYAWSNGKNDAQLAVNQSGTYCITVNDINGCKGDTCVTVLVKPLPKAAISGKILICGNQQTTLNIAPNNLQYQWSNGEKTTQIKVGSGTYKVTFTDAQNCSDTLSKTVIVAPDVALNAKAILQDNNLNISCFGSADGKAEVKILTGTAPYSYNWNTGEKAFFIQNLKAGKYQVTVTDALGCSQKDSVLLSEPPILDALFKANPVKCFGEKNGTVSIEVVNGGNGDFVYKFDNQQFKQLKKTPLSFENLKPGIYNVVVKDKKGCKVEQNLTVKSPLQLALKIPVLDTIIKNDSVNLAPILNFTPDSMAWLPPTNLSCSNCLNPYFKPTQYSTNFQFFAWKNGCPNSATIELISRTYRNHNVFIPNAFTPDDNGTNDVFTVMNNPTVASIEKLQIFDRWGELIWEAHDFIPEKLGWDGNFRGKPMNPAVFVYVAHVLFKDGEKGKFAGDFTLIR